jgi:hypothetical protein
LNALAKKARQKARNSASGFSAPVWPVAGAEDTEVIVAMTQDPLFHRGFYCPGACFAALNPSFGPIH